jgi:VCBS repeat-containing protein
VTVRGVNDAPTANDDRASTDEDTAITIAVLANDIDPDRTDRLHVTAINTSETRGQVILNADGSITYDPRGHFDFLARGKTDIDRFQYRIEDAHGEKSEEAEATITILGRNDPPTTVADFATVSEDGPQDGLSLKIDVLANDDDVDTDDDTTTLRVVAAQSAAGADVRFDGLAGAGLGYHPAGRFEYLAVGETAIDSITYTVEDRHGARATSTVSVTVRGANDAPTANDDRASTDEDTAITIAVLANDTDPDRTDRLQVTAINGESIAPGGRITLASGASVTMDAAGALAYDPRGHFDFLGIGEEFPRDDKETEGFKYRIEDGHGGSWEAEVTITIVGRNDPPTAVADFATVSEDGPSVSIDVLANDDDIDTDDGPMNLRVLAAEAASGAPVTFTKGFGAGITYDPAGRFDYLDEGETATDTITYRVADRRGGESIGTVTSPSSAPTMRHARSPIF